MGADPAEYIWGDRTLRTIHCKTFGCVTHWEPLAPTPTSRVIAASFGKMPTTSARVLHAGFSPGAFKDEADDGKCFAFVCDNYAPPRIEFLRTTAWAAIDVDHVQERDKVHQAESYAGSRPGY